MVIKILNLYAEIGGNRKLWSGDIEVTAIENNKSIAKIYQDFFPKDKVIVADAHQYLCKKHHDMLHMMLIKWVWELVPFDKKQECKEFIKKKEECWLEHE